MQAKKSYGQHFLKHDAIAQRIAESMRQATTTGKVLEVGPGMGMLTKFLLAHDDYQTYAVEADRDMVEYLQRQYPDFAQNRLISKDFLDFNAPEYFEGNPFCLIGNFPYNISTQILFKLLDWRKIVPEMVGMFQKEVADRVVSKPGSKVYGITSALAQAFYHTEYLFTVERGSFNPPPKVLSAVIRLTRKENFTLDCSEKLFRTIVKTAFNQRRKMLRNTLKPFFPGDILMSDPFFEKRPETLGWEEYVHLAQWSEKTNTP
ncbi:MAG: 16S rRNA (adenine(1518)-N(6)/adenine(1519)-N(6))-dimethyltransferase RsmA [Chitinophagales bacterium]|nr:16S rRNA (adenine(1518)-N(6)/adenine(1519)-N(6))-dimethyltransferase RsmA [Chitinophagales bacterium]